MLLSQLWMTTNSGAEAYGEILGRAKTMQSKLSLRFYQPLIEDSSQDELIPRCSWTAMPRQFLEKILMQRDEANGSWRLALERLRDKGRTWTASTIFTAINESNAWKGKETGLLNIEETTVYEDQN